MNAFTQSVTALTISHDDRVSWVVICHQTDKFINCQYLVIFFIVI